ncbi:MAG TPA: peptidase M50 [Mycobacterium sp.]|nr:peptidase M50 [Mycobacterium sp.]
MTTTNVVVLLFGGRRLPGPLRDLPVVSLDDVANCRRIIVVGSDADLASVLTRLLREGRLDVEVGHVRRRWEARRARTGQAQRVPLIRDETGTVIVGAAYWLPPAEDTRTLHGEAVTDDTVLFDGDVAGVRIEPTPTMPGLRARVLSGRMRPTRWITGRAAQLGTDGALVMRDGVPAPRPVRRSTFYRHTAGWLRVR